MKRNIPEDLEQEIRAIRKSPERNGFSFNTGPTPGVVVFGVAVLVSAIFYWARTILIPIALATLLTFLLAPLVSRLQRLGLNRSLSVTISVMFALLLLGGTIWFAAVQLRNLVDELPHYRTNIRQKVGDLRSFGKGGVVEKLNNIVGEVRREMDKGKPAQQAAPATVAPAAPAQEPALSLEAIEQPLALAGLVLLLLIYMLAQREELRNRIIRLMGYSNLSATTQVFEEMGQRISRYLLTQLAINMSFGLLVAVALSLIGLPYAYLWGFLSTLVIFVPVIGFWIAAVPPTLLSLAVFSSWFWPCAIIGLFLVLKLTNSILLEPLFYGKSAGVLQVPLLILLAFWTWLWGPFGLILATPLTVCLLVVVKHVPHLEFLSLLMSDEPAMEPHIHFYQRLLALDYDEAAEILENYVDEHSAEEAYDRLLLPALYYAKADRRRGSLSARQEQFIFKTVSALQEMAASEIALAAPHTAPASTLQLVGCPADGEADEHALMLLRNLIDPARFELTVLTDAALVSETVELVKNRAPVAFVIAALPPGGLAQTRYLCKRLRTVFPELRVIVLRWLSSEEQRQDHKALLAAGVDSIAISLLEVRDQINNLVLLSQPENDGKATRAQSYSREKERGVSQVQRLAKT